VHTFVRRHRRFFLAIALAGLALRLFFFFHFRTITDDSRVYADFASNWLQHGVYGQTELGQIVPSDSRLPGYPAFLAVLFGLFGTSNFNAVLSTQILLDILTCFIISDLARRVVSERAACIAFVLACLCPFLANYSAAALTESLEVLFTALALDLAVVGLESFESPVRFSWMAWAGCGAAIGAGILLRPDGGILLAGVMLYVAFASWKRWRQGGKLAAIAQAGMIAAFCALAPLVLWTLRNFYTLHHFQPLAPRYANETDELTPRGFNRWVKTWLVDYVSVEEIYWNVPGEKVDATKLPNRAFDWQVQRDRTLALIADYNQSQEMTPELDRRFGELAAERIRTHPARYYIVLPLARIADMWMRPRTEIMPPDPRWWEFNDERRSSLITVMWGIVNLAYVIAACVAIFYRGSRVRYLGLLLTFVLLRSAFLGTLENPETRYTLECYPVVIVLAAALDWKGQKSEASQPGIL